MGSGANQLSGVACPSGGCIGVSIQYRLPRVRFVAAVDTVKCEVGCRSTGERRGRVVRIRKNHSLIATDPLTIINMLVNEDIAVVGRVFNRALSHHGKRAMDTRPKFDCVISEGMVLDDTCVNAYC